MAKKKGRNVPTAEVSDKPATLKDLLGADTIAKLKEQANELKKEEQNRREAEQAKAEAARKAEQKRLDNDFEHLLNTSNLDWQKYK